MKDNAPLFTLCLIAALLIIPAVQAENVYRDNNPALFLAPPASHGYAIFMIRCGGSAMDTTVLFRNMDFQQNITLPAAGLLNVSRNLTEGGWGVTKVLPDGRSDIISFAAGNYEACLRDGNGGQPECQQFHIGGAATETVSFNGHAISGPRRPKPTLPPVSTKGSIKVESDPAGADIFIDEINQGQTTPYTFDNLTAGSYKVEVRKEGYDAANKTVNVLAGQITFVSFNLDLIPEVCETQQRLIKDAWDEIIKATPAWEETIYHPEVNYTVHHDKIPAVPGWMEYFGDYREGKDIYIFSGINKADYDITFIADKHGNYDKVENYYVYHRGYGHGSYKISSVIFVGHVYHKPVAEVPGWDEIIPTEKAWTEIIQHPETPEETIHHPAEYETILCPDEPLT